VLVAGLLLTGGLAWGASTIHEHNESHLLNVELRQAASVVAASVPSVQIPLVSAAELAQATDGATLAFQKYMTRFVGPSGEFVSASLWHVTGGTTSLVTSVGSTSTLSVDPGALHAFLLRAQTSSPFAVLNLLQEASPGVAYAAAGAPAPWVVLAERSLPKNRRLQVTKNSAFSQLNYAIYLGTSKRSSDLLGASPGVLPAGANSASVTVAFGDSAITIVASPNGELGGTLLARLPIIVALGGIALSLIAGFLTEYLVRRRNQAELLAAENRRMYSEQRSIAGILQQALLPQDLPKIQGVETSARYIAGSKYTDVGGDWYDVIVLDNNRFLFVVGDVSGHGVEAATLMARLHFAIRAFASQGDSPVDILAKMRPLLSLERDSSFATVLCGLVNVSEQSISLVNAGHPPLLLVNGSGGGFVDTVVFPPVGVGDDTDYQSTTIPVPAGSTILAFTDGLVERRGEVIDVGFARLRDIASEVHLSLDELLDKVVADMRDGAYNDDMAILAVRWNN
jgi:serine phosphatase RsbU (regulator of sigma subunit)